MYGSDCVEAVRDAFEWRPGAKSKELLLGFFFGVGFRHLHGRII